VFEATIILSDTSFQTSSVNFRQRMAHTNGNHQVSKKTPYVQHPPDGVPFVCPALFSSALVIADIPQFDDGREIELLHFVYSLPEIDQIRGDPLKVVAAIDKYATTKNYLMNVGPDKGKIVTDLITEVKPQMMVELGGYVGYSALLFGDAVRKAGGKRYYSLERNPEFAAVITSLIDLAGLSETVKVHVGPSDQSIARLHAEGALTHIDLMFLDHYKPAYTTDLKLCEHLKLIRPGSVLAADNVIKPGNPPYLEYVRSSIQQKKERFQDKNGNTYDNAGFSDRFKNQYSKRMTYEKPNLDYPGNPNLVYESQLINSWEPTGVPV
jgi:catechol O-methyltransferase